MEIKPKTTPPSYIKQQHTRTDGSFYMRDGSLNFNTPERLLEHRVGYLKKTITLQ